MRSSFIIATCQTHSVVALLGSLKKTDRVGPLFPLLLKVGPHSQKIVYAVMCIFLIARKTMLFGKSPDLANRPDQKGVVFDRWPLLLPPIKRRASPIKNSLCLFAFTSDCAQNDAFGEVA